MDVRPPGAPAERCRRGGTAGVGPRVGDHDPSQRDQQKRERTPQARGIVPVPVASTSPQPRSKQKSGAHRRPRPLPGKPQIAATDHQDEKKQVGSGSDGAQRPAGTERLAQRAMPAFDEGEEDRARLDPSPEHGARVGIDIDVSLAPERELDGGARRFGRMTTPDGLVPLPADAAASISTSCGEGLPRKRRHCAVRHRTTWSICRSKASSTPVTDMIRMAIPATTPIQRCVQKSIRRIIEYDVHSEAESRLKVARKVFRSPAMLLRKLSGCESDPH